MNIPPPPHHYAGLGVQAPAAQLDQQGYLVIVGEPERGDHPQVSAKIIIIIRIF